MQQTKTHTKKRLNICFTFIIYIYILVSKEVFFLPYKRSYCVDLYNFLKVNRIQVIVYFNDNFIKQNKKAHTGKRICFIKEKKESESEISLKLKLNFYINKDATCIII